MVTLEVAFHWSLIIDYVSNVSNFYVLKQQHYFLFLFDRLHSSTASHALSLFQTNISKFIVYNINIIVVKIID